MKRVDMHSQDMPICQHMNLIDHEKGGHAQSRLASFTRPNMPSSVRPGIEAKSRHEFSTIACHILNYKHAHAHDCTCTWLYMHVHGVYRYMRAHEFPEETDIVSCQWILSLSLFLFVYLSANRKLKLAIKIYPCSQCSIVQHQMCSRRRLIFPYSLKECNTSSGYHHKKQVGF